MPDSHALLSASSAHRWLNCPPSAKAVEGVADAPSDAALQGTAAHALAEHKLLRALKRRSKRPVSEFEDDEMDALTSDYVDFVLERLAEAREACADAQVFVEQRLDYSHVAPDGFGTGDAIIVAEPALHVVDLEYGMGVQVSAVDNPQLKLYGLGALAAFGALYDITEVRLSIFQPRRGNVETWTISAADLIAWGQETVAPIAAIAAQGGGEYKAGSWCQFCRIAPTCRARADANLALARHEFAPPAELTLDEVADVLTKIPELKAWASDVEAWALARAQAGTQVPGFKVVAGRSIRKYSVSLIIPKTDTETISKIERAIDAAIEAGTAKFGGKHPSKTALKLPLRDGDLERDDEAYKGCFFVNANSIQPPEIVDADLQPILSPTEVYSGCYARVSLSFYAFNTNGNRGIACGLGNLQKLRAGEPLGGGRTSAADDFAAFSAGADFLN